MIDDDVAFSEYYIFCLSVENEQAGAGRDGRTRLERSYSQARTGADRETFIFPVQLTTSKIIGNLTRLIHTLLYVMTIHTYIHSTTLLLPFPFHLVWRVHIHTLYVFLPDDVFLTFVITGKLDVELSA